MVRPGFKTKLATLAVALVAEFLRGRGMIDWGIEEVYAYMRPALEDILSFVSEEDYIWMMMLLQDAKRKATVWGRQSLTYLRNWF